MNPAAPESAVIADAARRLRAGELVAFPTETVYGLGVHALDRAAVRRLFAAKGRPATDPLIVHVTSFDEVRALTTDLPDAARRLADRFWPGPLTLVLHRAAAVPDEVTAGLDTVAIRVPAHPVARALIAAAALPVAAPSANLFSRPSPTLASHVLDDLDQRIDLVLDGGPTTVGVESTVLDLSRRRPVILRPGAVTLQQLQDVLGDVDTFAGSSTGAMASPGLLEKHYSPRAPLTLYTGEQDEAFNRLRGDAALMRAVDKKTIGLLVATEDRARLADSPGFVIADVGSLRNLPAVATRLYAALRELDAAGVDVILARDFPAHDGLGAAIHDRLTRAAAGRVVRR